MVMKIRYVDYENNGFQYVRGGWGWGWANQPENV